MRRRAVAPLWFRAADLRPPGCVLRQMLQIPDWCNGSTEYLPILAGDG